MALFLLLLLGNGAAFGAFFWVVLKLRLPMFQGRVGIGVRLLDYGSRVVIGAVVFLFVIGVVLNIAYVSGLL